MRHDFRRIRSTLVAFFVLFTLAGCATTRSGAPRTSDPWLEYERAVEAAKYPRPERVSRELVPIATWFDGLIWDDSRQKVLMVTWTKKSYYEPPPATLGATTWLTAAPFFQRFCQALGLHGEALDMRLRQRLGLPPDSVKDAVVEMWVSPADFFRPCPDPEVNDRECQVSLTTGTVDHTGPCPWPPGQVSGKFVEVSQAHALWMCDNWTSSYPPGEPRKSYPWTALGYTYDWAPSAPGHVGDSEFVAPKGTPIAVRAVVPTAEYCAGLAARR